MINLQKLFGVAQQFVGNDILEKAKALSQNVNSPKSAIEALSKVGNSNDIIENGLKQIDTPMGKKIANMVGVTDEQLGALRTQIIGLKESSIQPVDNSYNSRLENLRKGLK